MPSLRRRPATRSHRAQATPSLGLAADPTDHRRIPTLPWPLLVLWHHDPGELARRSADGTVWASTGCFHRSADGPLSPKQTPGVDVSGRLDEHSLPPRLDRQDSKPRQRIDRYPNEQLRSQLESQPQLFVDESPTKEKRKKAWLWVAVAPMFAVFGIFGNRSRESLVSLVGDYSGIIVNCDRAKRYLDGKRLQWCWAHLKRDIQKLIDSSDGKVKRLGHDLMRQQGLLFEQWRRYKAEEISWRGFQNLAGRDSRSVQ